MTASALLKFEVGDMVEVDSKLARDGGGVGKVTKALDGPWEGSALETYFNSENPLHPDGRYTGEEFCHTNIFWLNTWQ